MLEKKSNKVLLGIAAIVALAFLLLRPKASPPGGGVVTPSGAISSVDVAQGAMRAGHRRRKQGIMGAHLIPKAIGGTVSITVSWTAATKSFSGQAIAWNYGISWRYIHPLTGALRSGGFFNIGSRPNGTFIFGASDPVDVGFFPGDWSVQVVLHADNSSPTGEPLNDMPTLQGDALAIGFAEHTNAFRVA